ncbi:glycosyltransferase family 9 protein [Botryobacter ruber]|uniref:glycosyltransferase family 9 protein n=1 Tax=Botryobacter ruber TaxID=2171629 RepID=UPI000E0B620B|nr:glycosyltransferase family 9 protein [Botryobacter ruber]
MKTFLISRPDAIGDVVLTLPMCGWLKNQFEGCRVVFLGTTYTEPVVACSEHVDLFINADKLLVLPWEEQVNFLKELQPDVFLHVLPNKHLARLAKAAEVPVRVGTRSRWYHWLTCNKLVSLSRKNSDLHESQLNMLLLTGAGVKVFPALQDMHLFYGFTKIDPLPEWLQQLLVRDNPEQLNIILHPKSRGSGREWSLVHYSKLAKKLHKLGHQVFITGTAKEGEFLREWLQEHSEFVTDMTGRLTLPEFISFARAVDGLVACSTGTLHIAAAVGVHALGIYPPIRPAYPGRWGPVGEKASVLLHPIKCNACSSVPETCICINYVRPEQVIAQIKLWHASVIN